MAARRARDSLACFSRASSRVRADFIERFNDSGKLPQRLVKRSRCMWRRGAVRVYLLCGRAVQLRSVEARHTSIPQWGETVGFEHSPLLFSWMQDSREMTTEIRKWFKGNAVSRNQ